MFDCADDSATDLFKLQVRFSRVLFFSALLLLLMRECTLSLGAYHKTEGFSNILSTGDEHRISIEQWKKHVRNFCQWNAINRHK